MKRLLRRGAPVALLATGACFATRQDVMLLQSNLAAMRADEARADSAMLRRLWLLADTLGVVNDSLGRVSARLTKLQGDVRGDLYEIGQQLIQVQELTGQSQQRVQELRAALEQRQQDLAAPPSGAGAVTDSAGATAAPAAPGPNQLYQLSLDQLRRGSAGAARTGFEELLRQYPTADIAPDAQFYLAEAMAAQGDSAAADSAYAAVVARYPKSSRAATALYKRALAADARGEREEARGILQTLVAGYPRSDEAALARERLRSP